ncbi:MAG: hypothetical protein KatS3mg063_0566 [Tepidiforma sp.]|nr:MAG: hypothetical protein KatS3mg063_0566 [Tepidiforma sp.]
MEEVGPLRIGGEDREGHAGGEEHAGDGEGGGQEPAVRGGIERLEEVAVEGEDDAEAAGDQAGAAEGVGVESGAQGARGAEGFDVLGGDALAFGDDHLAGGDGADDGGDGRARLFAGALGGGGVDPEVGDGEGAEERREGGPLTLGSGASLGDELFDGGGDVALLLLRGGAAADGAVHEGAEEVSGAGFEEAEAGGIEGDQVEPGRAADSGGRFEGGDHVDLLLGGQVGPGHDGADAGEVALEGGNPRIGELGVRREGDCFDGGGGLFAGGLGEGLGDELGIVGRFERAGREIAFGEVGAEAIDGRDEDCGAGGEDEPKGGCGRARNRRGRRANHRGDPSIPERDGAPAAGVYGPARGESPSPRTSARALSRSMTR